MALLSSLVINIAKSVYGKPSEKLSTLADFLLDWDVTQEGYGEPKKQTMNEMKTFLLGFAEAQNARIEKEKERQKK